MKIIKVGDFNKQGNAIGWELDFIGGKLGEGEKEVECCVYLHPDGRVFVGGVEIVEWTEKRRKAMVG